MEEARQHKGDEYALWTDWLRLGTGNVRVRRLRTPAQGPKVTDGDRIGQERKG